MKNAVEHIEKGWHEIRDEHGVTLGGFQTTLPDLDWYVRHWAQQRGYKITQKIEVFSK